MQTTYYGGTQHQPTPVNVNCNLQFATRFKVKLSSYSRLGYSSHLCLLPLLMLFCINESYTLMHLLHITVYPIVDRIN